MKATAKAHPNLAFIKYWGRKDEALRLPSNGSISMNLSALSTTTTVEFSKEFSKDEIVIDGEIIVKESERVTKHLDRIRTIAKSDLRAKVVSQNNFPSGTGLSSSSSGFAALTIAAAKALELTLSEKELSILARQGSGSACRSIPGGFVEWLDGDTSESSYALSIFPADHWSLVDIVAVVSNEKKDVSTSVGMMSAASSPFYESRIKNISHKIEQVKQFIADRDFTRFGELVESEALEMHAIMLTSHPSLIYWSEGTLRLMKEIKKWRSEGLEAYFTINTGQDIHILCEEKTKNDLYQKLQTLDYVKDIFVNNPSEGAKIIDSHLF